MKTCGEENVLNAEYKQNKKTYVSTKFKIVKKKVYQEDIC